MLVLKMLEVMDGSVGLPILANYFLRSGEITRAIEASRMVQELKPYTEMFKAMQQSLINAYGKSDAPNGLKKIVGDTDDAVKYRDSLMKLISEECTITLDPIIISKDEAIDIGSDAFSRITKLIYVSEEGDDGV